ncbi:MAG: hypothetical protein HQK54_06155 [Oligoflexales bacterium]|nr:hypothetical protein [Oligoflexales bacterium]
MKMFLHALIPIVILCPASCRDGEEKLKSQLSTTMEKATRTIYAGGHSENCDNVQIPGYWRNGEWIELPAPSSGTRKSVTGLALKGVEIYASGYTYPSVISGVKGVYWKNGVLSDLKTPSAGFSNFIGARIVIKGEDIYIGGYSSYFSSEKSTMSVAMYWKNDTVTALTSEKINSRINDMTISGNDIYAAGGVQNEQKIMVPGYWKNWEFVKLTPADPAKSSEAKAITVIGTNVYAAGYTKNDSGVELPVYWINGAVKALAAVGDSAKSDMEVTSIAVSGSDVYVGGYIDNSSGATTAGYWKNEVWTQLPSLDQGSSILLAMTASGPDVYAAGGSGGTTRYENTVGSKMSAASWVPGYWKNGVFNALTPKCKGRTSGVEYILVVDSP